MPKVQGSTTLAVLSVGAAVAGCQTAPVRYADTGVHATYNVAATGAGAVKVTGTEMYQGAGRAIRAPLHDLNLMQDQIAPVLLRAEDHPYDLKGVNSCGDVLNHVAELDLSLGPDVDTPKQRHRTRIARGADFAASTALDAAGSAAEHFIPMRSTIKQLSGAQRYENHVKHAVLAGETRRSFLKAIGMAHGCSWPAAPLDFHPAQVADVSAPWSAAAGGAVMLASTGASAAQAGSATQGQLQPATLQGSRIQTASNHVAPSQTAPSRTAAILPASLSTGASRTTAASTGSRVARVHAAPASRPAVYVAVRERLDIPPAAPMTSDPDQSWRPSPSSQGGIVQVSDPVSSTAVATRGGVSSPWGAGFANTSSARP